MNHYEWLEINLVSFLQTLKIPDAEYGKGLVVAHGDKCYSYKSGWDDAYIPFEHGVAIYLLTYLHPYNKETRETDNGWVYPHHWVKDNYSRFKDALAPVE